MIGIALFLLAPLLLIAAPLAWRHSRADGLLLAAGGAMGFGHLLLWQLGLGPLPLPLMWLDFLTGATAIYLMAVVYLIRSFTTPLEGPVRTLYRLVGLVALAPIFVFFVFFPLLHLL